MTPGSGQSSEPAATDTAMQLRDAAYTPTLFGGCASAGGVKVWKPARRVLWASILTSGLMTAAYGLVAIPEVLDPTRRLTLFTACGGISALWFVKSLRSLRRPRYLATDETGIAIATRKGSRTFRWTEIEWVNFPAACLKDQEFERAALGVRNELDDGTIETVALDLNGFPTQMRQELRWLIAEKAGLGPSIDDMRWTRSHGPLPLSPAASMSAPPS